MPFPETPQEIGSIVAYRKQMLDNVERNDTDYNSLVELMCADCLICGENVKQQADCSCNARLIDELINIASVIDGHEEYYETRYNICAWTLEVCTNHPRLHVRLLEAAINAMIALEGTDAFEPDLLSLHRAELADVEYNISCADIGEFDRIIQKGHLRRDPVEWTEEYERAIDDAEAEAYGLLADTPRGMGFCFAYWGALKTALAARGIDWHTPPEMNPRVMFD